MDRKNKTQPKCLKGQSATEADGIAPNKGLDLMRALDAKSSDPEAKAIHT